MVIGISITDLRYLFTVWRQLGAKKAISTGDLSASIRRGLRRKDIAIRVHAGTADANTDRPFSIAVAADDIPDYTILLEPGRELKDKLLSETFSREGKYGFAENNAFVTSELIVVSGSKLGVGFQSLFVLGRLNSIDTTREFVEFKDLPLRDLLVTQCFLVENKRGELRCYEVTSHCAQRHLLALTRRINQNNSLHVGIKMTKDDGFGDDRRVFEALHY